MNAITTRRIGCASDCPKSALHGEQIPGIVRPCLLYTSDAADERSSVDLGGRRIIKKKQKLTLEGDDVAL